jgi:hypothetical protein
MSTPGAFKVRTNIKGFSPDVVTPLTRFNAFIGPNESFKTTLALAATLPLTGIALDELYRPTLTGRTLKALRVEGDQEVWSEISINGDDDVIAEWRLKGGGNPTMTGDAAGRYTDIWSTLRDGLVGRTPKLTLMLLDTPRGQRAATPEMKAARVALEAAEADLKKIKGSDPGAVPTMPPDPREAVLDAFKALENTASKGVDTQAYRRTVVEKVADLTRWKDGQRVVEAKLAFDKALAAAKAAVDTRKDELVRVVQPLADTVCAEASKLLGGDRKLVMDLSENDVTLIKRVVAHLAPSGTLEAWMHMALGSVLWGGRGVLAVPDLQWDAKNGIAWMEAASRSDLGMVTLTLATLNARAKLPAAWNVVRLGE